MPLDRAIVSHVPILLRPASTAALGRLRQLPQVYSLALVADTSISGRRVARELDDIIRRRGRRPETIVSDNGTELTSNAILS